MADLLKVKRNIQRMLDQGAPEAEIDSYVNSEGTSPDELRGQTMQQKSVATTVGTNGNPDLLKSFVEEALYKPMLDTRYSPIQRVMRQALHPAVAAAKGLGGYYQRASAALANPIIEMQKGNFAPNLSGIRGITGEQRGTFEDVLTNARVPKHLAVIGDLIASAGIPGIGEVAGILGQGAKIGRRVATKAIPIPFNALGRYSQRSHLLALVEDEGAINRAIERGFKDIPKDLTEASAQSRLYAVRDKILEQAEKHEESAQVNFGKVLRESEHIPTAIKTTPTGTNLTDSAWDMLNHSAFVDEAGNVVSNAGTDKLVDVMSRLEKKATETGLTIKDIRAYMTEIDKLAKNARGGSLYAIANELRSTLATAVKDTSTELAQASQSYRSMITTLNGLKERTPGIYDIVHQNKLGGAQLAQGGYYKQSLRGQEALGKFEQGLPQEGKFLDELKNASYVNEFSREKPAKGASAAALATFALRAPWMLPILAGTGSMLAPRKAAGFYKKLFSISSGMSSIVKSIAKKPITKAIEDLLDKGMLGTGILRGLRDLPYGDFSNPENTDNTQE